MSTDTVVTEEARKQAWLFARRQHITSSDLGALLGLEDAYGSPMKVWLEKTGQLERGKEPDWLEAGLRLQPVILNWYADRRGVALAHVDPYHLEVCPENSVLAASLDAQWAELDGEGNLVRLARCVDAKNVRFARPDQWGDEGTDQIPGRYLVQLHAQMMCTGQREVADLATLFGGADPRYYTVRFDPEIAAGILEAAETFWEKHVLADVPPEVDASDDWEKWLNARAVRYADYVEATPEVVEWRAQALEAGRRKAEAEETEKLFKNKVRAFIGEHPGLILPDGKKVHYKRNKDGVEVNHEAALLALAHEHGVDVATLLSQYTTPKPGARPLLLGKE